MRRDPNLQNGQSSASSDKGVRACLTFTPLTTSTRLYLLNLFNLSQQFTRRLIDDSQALSDSGNRLTTVGLAIHLNKKTPNLVVTFE